jgi:hypothetical protein
MSLLDFLKEFTPTKRGLGLVHCTPVLYGLPTLVQGELRTNPCPVYDNRPMVYLFYGRPAFKPLAGMAAGGIKEHLPMCLVLDAALLGRAVRILPFDSGGFDRYAPFVQPLARQQFELAPRRDVPRRIVSAFYETNLAYFHQMPARNEDDISLLHPEARAIARLAHDNAVADDDDRRATIEIQLEDNVSLPQALKAIIGPPFIMDEPATLEAIRASGAVPITYETYGRQRPTFYSSQLYDRVQRFFRRQRML